MYRGVTDGDHQIERGDFGGVGVDIDERIAFFVVVNSNTKFSLDFGGVFADIAILQIDEIDVWRSQDLLPIGQRDGALAAFVGFASGAHDNPTLRPVPSAVNRFRQTAICSWSAVKKPLRRGKLSAVVRT